VNIRKERSDSDKDLQTERSLIYTIIQQQQHNNNW